ncbi:MAG: response regulator transcription factor [Desulfurivibrio sp.]|nr:response regulator transcription factor [Desulfurivibrio sp.]
MESASGDTVAEGSRATILIVEDDENIQQLVGYNLARAGFQVLYADDGEQALARVAKENPDLVVLDLMLPGLDGHEVCKALRRDPRSRRLPIIMLTARSDEDEISAGLDLGADDYITKPFSPKVLLSRIKSVLRRGREPEGDGDGATGVVQIQDITIDCRRYQVAVAGEPVALTLSEFGILELLARRPGWVFSRQQIIDAVRGYDYAITPRAVDVQVFGLRKKLGEAGACIETVRGVGYRLKA